MHDSGSAAARVWSIAVVGIAFADRSWRVELKRRDTPPQAQPPVPRADPGAVVESTRRQHRRASTATRRRRRIDYKRLLTYPDGATKMLGVTSSPTSGDGRTFTITGEEGQVGENESTMELTGDVRLEASDGLVVTAEHATYAEADGIVRAPGPVTFSRGRMTGTGVGHDLRQERGHPDRPRPDAPSIDVDADDKGSRRDDVAVGRRGVRARREAASASSAA